MNTPFSVPWPGQRGLDPVGTCPWCAERTRETCMACGQVCCHLCGHVQFRLYRFLGLQMGVPPHADQDLPLLCPGCVPEPAADGYDRLAVGLPTY